MKQLLPLRDPEALAVTLKDIESRLGGVRLAASALGISAATLCHHKNGVVHRGRRRLPRSIGYDTYLELRAGVKKLDARRRPPLARAEQEAVEWLLEEKRVLPRTVGDLALRALDREGRGYADRLERAVVGRRSYPALERYWVWVRNEFLRLDHRFRPMFRHLWRDKATRDVLEPYLARHRRPPRHGRLLDRARNKRAWIGLYRALERLNDGESGIDSGWQGMAPKRRAEFLYHALTCETVLLRQPDEEVRSLLMLARQKRQKTRR